MDFKDKAKECIEDYYNWEFGFPKKIKYALEVGDEETVIEEALRVSFYYATVSRINKSLIFQNSDLIKKWLKDEILSSALFCDDFTSWHKKICTNTFHDTQYEFWQRLINETFKYMYCVNKMSNNKMFNNFKHWDSCHCCVDSITARQLLELIDGRSLSCNEMEHVKDLARGGHNYTI